MPAETVSKDSNARENAGAKFLNIILGRPLASSEQDGRKIGVFAGLPALGLDGLSSCAYGPEAALAILAPVGLVGLHYILPITCLILALLFILYFSYRQTIAAYPANGGSYTVAKENLGKWASFFSAAALMIDYILTVAVGISAGIAALVSAVPSLHPYTLTLCLVVLAIVTIANLRGTSEAGIAFAVPVYIFLVSMAIVLGLGLVKAITGGAHPSAVIAPPVIHPAVESVGAWLLLRAFASGCTAMTGVEAVSNGVNVFKEPTIKNAHRTLTWIVGILAVLLGCIAFLVHAYGIGAMDQEHDPNYQSVISQLTGAVVGHGILYKITLISVLAVLCLSANTSFVGFPRLCQLIAKDDFLPKAFATVGRRLVYSVGVLFLAGFAALLLIAFRGITDKLIPLYAVGAFMAFTLSQSGMVVHWLKQGKNPDPQAGESSAVGAGSRRLKIAINGTGAVATAMALAIILAAKFIEGAWITIVAIPILLLLFWLIHRYYHRVRRQIATDECLDLHKSAPPIVVLPFMDWNRPTAKALRFAMRMSDDVVAIHLSNLDGDAAKDEAAHIREHWVKMVELPAKNADMPAPQLEFVSTPYREFVQPLIEKIDELEKEKSSCSVVVIIPEIAVRHWWQTVLHSSRATRLRVALHMRKDSRVVVIEVPWFLQD